MRITEDELLAQWKRRLGITSQSCGCEVTFSDGTDFDLALRERLRSRYAQLLLTAPPELLPMKEMAGKVRSRPGSDGRVRFTLPPGECRVLSLKLRDWSHELTRMEAPGSAAERMAGWPGMEPTNDNPLAILNGRLLEAAPASELESLIVAGSSSEEYELDPSLLEELLREE